MKNEMKKNAVTNSVIVNQMNDEGNAISDNEAKLLMEIAKQGEKEWQRKKLDEYLESITKYGYDRHEGEYLYSRGLTIIPWHDYLIEAGEMDEFMDRIFERKLELMRKIEHANSKAKQRKNEIKAACKVCIQIYEDESVSLLIHPESTDCAPELYRFGGCDGLIVYSYLEGINGFPNWYMLDSEGMDSEYALKRLNSVILDFTLTGDPTLADLAAPKRIKECNPLDANDEDIIIVEDDGNVKSSYDDLPF